MNSSRTLHIKTYILLFLLVSVGSIGNTILDKGMKDIGTVDIFTRGRILERGCAYCDQRDDLAGHRFACCSS